MTDLISCFKKYIMLKSTVSVSKVLSTKHREGYYLVFRCYDNMPWAEQPTEVSVSLSWSSEW